LTFVRFWKKIFSTIISIDRSMSVKRHLRLIIKCGMRFGRSDIYDDYVASDTLTHQLLWSATLITTPDLAIVASSTDSGIGFDDIRNENDIDDVFEDAERTVKPNRKRNVLDEGEEEEDAEMVPIVAASSKEPPGSPSSWNPPHVLKEPKCDRVKYADVFIPLPRLERSHRTIVDANVSIDADTNPSTVSSDTFPFELYLGVPNHGDVWATEHAFVMIPKHDSKSLDCGIRRLCAATDSLQCVPSPLLRIVCEYWCPCACSFDVQLKECARKSLVKYQKKNNVKCGERVLAHNQGACVVIYQCMRSFPSKDASTRSSSFDSESLALQLIGRFEHCDGHVALVRCMTSLCSGPAGCTCRPLSDDMKHTGRVSVLSDRKCTFAAAPPPPPSDHRKRDSVNDADHETLASQTGEFVDATALSSREAGRVLPAGKKNVVCNTRHETKSTQSDMGNAAVDAFVLGHVDVVPWCSEDESGDFAASQRRCHSTASTLDNPTDQKFRPSRLFDSDEISH
jgi:hypothetical protein